MPCFVPVELVLVGLDRSDHHVDRVVLHVHPRHVARPIVVGLERFGAQAQVVGQTGVARELGCLPQLLGRRRMLFLEFLVVRDRDELTRVVSADQGIEAAQLWIVADGRLELVCGHVVGIEIGSCGLGAHVVDERFVAMQSVPRTEVYSQVLERRRVIVRQRRRPAAITVCLIPEDLVHRFDCLDEQSHDFLIVLRQMRQVGLEADRRVLCEQLVHLQVFPCRFVVVLRVGATGSQHGRGEKKAQGSSSHKHVGGLLSVVPASSQATNDALES